MKHLDFLLERSVMKYEAFLPMLPHLDGDPVGYNPVRYLQDTTKPVMIPPDPSKDRWGGVIYVHLPQTEYHNP